MSGTPSISHGSGGASGLSEKPLRTKLNNKIDTLNPLDRLRIADWLIDFKAAAGVEYAIVFNDDYELELLCRASLGLSISAYPTFAHMEAEFVKWRNENVRAKAAIVYAWLVTNIAWTKDPILAQMVRGSPQNPKKSWDSAQNGQAFFAWLRERGSAAQTHVQQDLEADWAAIYSEAVLAQMGKPRTRVIFQDVSCADSVIDTLTLILSNYEKIEAHATASPLVFIKSMLSLMKDDVVPVQAWAERQLNELVLGEADVPTSRASWLSDNVSRLLHLRLPSRTSTFVSLEQHAADSKATKISGSDVLLALRTQGNAGNAQNYSAPRTANGKPFGNKAAPEAKPSRFEGLCSFCPCRGCNNGPDDPIETCCILGSGEVKPDATADNIGFAESVRGMVKEQGAAKFMKPPYLKGQAWRSEHEARAHRELHRAIGVTLGQPLADAKPVSSVPAGPKARADLRAYLQKKKAALKKLSTAGLFSAGVLKQMESRLDSELACIGEDPPRKQLSS